MHTQRAMTVLQVADLDRSLIYYQRLGFAISGIWGDPPGVAITQRGDVTIMLQLADTVHNAGGRWSVYIYVDDIEALYAEYLHEGIDVPSPPEDRYYGCRDITVTDPDGHALAFGAALSPEPHGPGKGANRGLG